VRIEGEGPGMGTTMTSCCLGLKRNGAWCCLQILYTLCDCWKGLNNSLRSFLPARTTSMLVCSDQAFLFRQQARPNLVPLSSFLVPAIRAVVNGAKIQELLAVNIGYDVQCHLIVHD
jgi:hypothetical protein